MVKISDLQAELDIVEASAVTEKAQADALLGIAAPVITNASIGSAFNILIISGTAKANSNVNVFDGGVTAGSTSADASGVWSFITGALPDGTHSFTATASEVVTNVSSQSAPVSVVVNTTPPPVIQLESQTPGTWYEFTGTRADSADPGLDYVSTFTGELTLGSNQITNISGKFLIGQLLQVKSGTGKFPIGTVIKDISGNVAILSNAATAAGVCTFAGKACWNGVTGFSAIMSAWSGGCYDTLRHYLLIWGGGHQDFYGNFVMACGPFNSPNPKWKLLTLPSLAIPAAALNGTRDGVLGLDYYDDGTPAARHTYTKIGHDKRNDRLMSVMNSGKLYAADSLDLSTLPNPPVVGGWKSDWSRYAGTVGAGIHGAGCYNDNDDCFYLKPDGSTALAKFDPNKVDPATGLDGLWSYLPSKNTTYYTNPDSVMAVDTKRNRIVCIGAHNVNNNPPYYFDLNTPGATKTYFTSTGDGGGIALESAPAPGFFYDDIGDRFICWHNGVDVFQLNAQTFEWLKLENDPSNTVTPASGYSQYGRMQFIKEYNAFIVASSTSTNVFAYKLGTKTLAAVPPPPPTLVNGKVQLLQTAVDQGGTVTIGAGSLPTGAVVTKVGTTIAGAGPASTHIVGGGSIWGKGALVVEVPTDISGISCEDVGTSVGGNQAGVRHDAGKLTLTDMNFLRCQDGYLGSFDVDFLRCSFDTCGTGDGFTHAIYSSAGTNLVTCKDCSFKGTKVGHHFKSRAVSSILTNNFMYPASESYSCDFPWGGSVSIDKLTAEQGALGQNAVMINYGSEVNPTPYTNHSLAISNSLLTSSGVANAVAVRVDSKTPCVPIFVNVSFNGFTTICNVPANYSGCSKDGVAIPDGVH